MTLKWLVYWCTLASICLYTEIELATWMFCTIVQAVVLSQLSKSPLNRYCSLCTCGARNSMKGTEMTCYSVSIYDVNKHINSNRRWRPCRIVTEKNINILTENIRVVYVINNNNRHSLLWISSFTGYWYESDNGCLDVVAWRTKTYSKYMWFHLNSFGQ